MINLKDVDKFKPMIYGLGGITTMSFIDIIHSALMLQQIVAFVTIGLQVYNVFKPKKIHHPKKVQHEEE